MRYEPGLVKQAGDVHPDEMTIPLLFFTQGEFTLEAQERYLNDPSRDEGPNVLNAWRHGDLITIYMLGLMHLEHSSMYQRNEHTWKGYSLHRKGDYERVDGIIGYAWIARYTLQFLDAYLKQNSSAMDYLKRTPAENGVPKHVLTVDFRGAKGVPASLDAFRAELGLRGFDKTAAIYAELRKEKAGFTLDEGALSAWSTELITDNHVPEAIELLKLNLQIHPDSTDAITNLADAYADSGQKTLAIEAYQKELAKNLDNENARKN